LSKDQKINYLPNANNTFRKDVLTDNINRFRRDFPEVFEDIMPRSWDLPKEYEEFSLFCDQNSMATGSQPYFIVKENNEQRGDGIYLTNNPKSDIKNTDDVVVSLYIDKPLLMDSCKFDFRVFVLIASLDPLTIYVHEEGLMRLASERYQHPNAHNKKNLYMHLTNGSLNTKNKNSIHKAISANSLKAFENENMLVRSFEHFKKYLEGVGVDSEKVFEEMDQVVAKVILASLEDLKKGFENEDGSGKCFQVLGFDLMLDEEYKPWFIEVNHNPDFVDDPKIASLIHRKTVQDTIEIIANLNQKSLQQNKSTGEAIYDDEIYCRPNMYRKVDVEKIEKSLRARKDTQLTCTTSQPHGQRELRSSSCTSTCSGGNSNSSSCSEEVNLNAGQNNQSHNDFFSGNLPIWPVTSLQSVYGKISDTMASFYRKG